MSSILKIFALLAVALLLVGTAHSTTFYVSTTGNDASLGTSPEEAWKSIDNGELTGQVQPGDTVNILPGTYYPSEPLRLETYGTEDSVIVYRRLGKSPVVVDGGDSLDYVISVEGDHTRVYGLEIKRAVLDNVRIQNYYTVITNCYIHSAGRNGVDINNRYALILRNTIVDNTETGVKVEGLGDVPKIFGNTICFNGDNGVEVLTNVYGSRVQNNIICSNDGFGIKGDGTVVCSFNNVWANNAGNYEGTTSTGGEISTEPQFVDADNGRFDLRAGAREIDAGLYVGYEFSGSAPEIGAFEKYNVYYVATDGSDDYSGLFPDSAWATVGNSDSLLYPGDTVYVLPGVYTDSVFISQSGLDGEPIFYVGTGDTCLIDGTGAFSTVRIVGDYIHWTEIDVKNGSSSNFLVSQGTRNTISHCNIGGANFASINMTGWYHTVYGNVFGDSQSMAEIIANGVGHRFINNTFYGDNELSQINAVSTIFCEARNNIFVSPAGTGKAVRFPELSEISHCIFHGFATLIEGGGILGDECLSADPLMIDPENDNFHLSLLSPAIDAGSDEGFPFNGPAPDMGAFETSTPESIQVVDAIDTMSADSSYQFSVVAFDSEGYPAKPGALYWSHSFSTGSISSAGVFTPKLVGSGEIIVGDISYGLIDSSATITVAPGALNDIDLSPKSDTLAVNSTTQFTVSGLDEKDNVVSELGNVSWEVLNGIGTIDQDGLFTARQVGFGFVRASSDLGPTCVSDAIAVISGEIEVNIAALPIPPKELIPGTFSGPLLAMELSNSDISEVSIDSIRLNFTGHDPDGATQTELDSQVDIAALYLELDNQYTSISSDDSLLAEDVLEDGCVVFATPGLVMGPNGGSIRLLVAAELNPELTKNGNSIAFELAEAVDIYLGEPVPAVGDFPIQNDVPSYVNSFQSAGVTVNPVEPFTLIYGQSERVILDLDLPRNGYADDWLSSMTLINKGTLEENENIINVALWADVTGDGFSGDDVRLGNFEHYSGFWQLSGLSHLLTERPNRVLITARVIDNQFEGGSLAFEIPVKGIEYLSGTDGPDDGLLCNPYSFVVMPANRITAVSIPSASTSVVPGSYGNTVLTFALYNGYGSARTLSSVGFTNHSVTQSTSDFADRELGQVSLLFDENYDRLMDGDPVVASGCFEDGRLRLTVSDLALPPEALCYFFVSLDLPLYMIDSDSLSVAIDNESDLVFVIDGEEVTSINGDMPLTSGGFLVVDGSIKAQYEILPVTSGSVSPGDTSITLFAFRPAANGDQIDHLTALTVENAGDAGSTDFESLQLWLDLNGDDLWQSSDSLVESFAHTVDHWSVTPAALQVTSDSPALFVVADVAATASPGVTFQAEIPVGGCQYASGNDGPLDWPLTGGGEFVVSSSGMRLTTQPLSPSYSIGQEITIAASVNNLLASAFDEVYCEFVSVADGSDSIVVGPLPLASLSSTEFVGTFTASRVGTESWRVRAFSASPADSSGAVHTDVTEVFETPSDVFVELLNSAPTAVSRGQSNVFPLSIRFYQDDSSAIRSSLRLDSLVIEVEDADGQPLAADAVFSRMAVATDNTTLVVNNSMPAQPTVTLNFSEPVIVPAGTNQLLSFLVDIDSSATASSFALVLRQAPDINIVDNNTLTPVDFRQDVIFPMSTASCRVEDASQHLAISGTSLLGPYVNYGQENVSGLEVVVRHPGESGTSQVQVTSVSLELVDESLVPIVASELISGLRVLRQQMIIGELTEIAPGADSLFVDFTAPPTLNPGEIESLQLVFDINPLTVHDAFAVKISDSTAFAVREVSSGSIITAVSDAELATGNVFPMLTGVAELKTPAVAPEICLSSSLPEYIIGGAEGVELLEILATYPVDEDHSPVRIKDISVSLFDSLGAPLNPNELLDQIGASVDDAPVIYEPFIELRDGATVFHLNEDGLMVNPGDTTAIRLCADVESATSVEHFYIRVQSDYALTLVDATDTSSNPGISVSASCGSGFPFSTDITEVYLRAGRPTISVSTPGTQLVYPGQTSVQLLQLTVAYNSPSPQGDLLLNSLYGRTMERTVSGLKALDGSTVFENLAIRSGGETLPTGNAFFADSATLTVEDGLTIQHNTAYELMLVCDIRDDAPLGNYLLNLADSTFCELLDKNLLSGVYPILSGASYPLWSAELSLTHASLENSFTNYPNPFNPESGEEATIGYVLTEDAVVSIDLYTVTGDLVARLATDEFRGEGPHQEDTWDGRNGAGRRVLPGTYFCRLTADYVSGRTETFKRKITVIW